MGIVSCSLTKYIHACSFGLEQSTKSTSATMTDHPDPHDATHGRPDVPQLIPRRNRLRVVYRSCACITAPHPTAAGNRCTRPSVAGSTFCAFCRVPDHRRPGLLVCRCDCPSCDPDLRYRNVRSASRSPSRENPHPGRVASVGGASQPAASVGGASQLEAPLS